LATLNAQRVPPTSASVYCAPLPSSEAGLYATPVVERVELSAGPLQWDRRRVESPCDARIGHPLREEVGEALASNLLGCERERGPAAVWCVDDHP